jgi:hypothetical protein
MSYGQGSSNPIGNASQPPNPYAPPPGGGGPGKPLPPGSVKNYLVEAILCLVCCGGVFAIPAIIYAAQVNSKLSAGDYQGALEASQNAKKWCIIAVCIGVVCTGLLVGLQILGAVAGNM